MAEQKNDLAAEVAALKAELAKKADVEKTLLESNTELQAKLEDAETTIEEVKIIVTHEKKKYQVVVPRFQFAEKVYAAKDLKTNPEVVKALVEKGSGVLKAI